MKDSPELTIVFRDSDQTYFDNSVAGTLNTTKWHSDMSYEV